MLPDVDVAVAAPYRYRRPTIDNAVDELRAAWAAGLKTAAIDLSYEAMTSRVDPVLEHMVAEYGLCLYQPSETPRATLLVLRGLMSHAYSSAARLKADKKVVVITDPVAGDVGTTWRRLGDSSWPTDLVVAPEGPRAREEITRRVSAIRMEPQDWLPVLEPSEWSIPQSDDTHELRLGVMLPPDLPTSAATSVAQLLPLEGPVRLLVGGTTDARGVQERLPSRFCVASADVFCIRSFLRDIDMLAAPSRMWPPLRYCIGSLLAGRPVVVIRGHPAGSLPPAVEVEENGLSAKLSELVQNPSYFSEQVEYARAWARSHASLEVTAERFGGVKNGSWGSREIAAVRGSAPRRQVLFISSNGAGTGHLTRLAAMARKASSNVEPFFVSLSEGVGLLEHNGWIFEHVPSADRTGLNKRDWNRLLKKRLMRVLHEQQPTVIVFDGTWPYAGLVGALLSYETIGTVWCRRAMWRADVGEGSLAKSSVFDVVVEPGELAAPFDAGATAAASEAHGVEPVLYSSPEEALDTDTARAELGIPEGPAILVTLGAGNINDVTSPLRRIVEVLASHGVHVCVTDPDIAQSPFSLDQGAVIPVRTRPLTPFLPAFDAAVSASGYNSYHELIAHGIPTLFIPNQETAVDDQLARARYAAWSGIGLCCSKPEGRELESALRELLDVSLQAAMRFRLAGLEGWRGAEMAMELVERLVASVPWPVGTGSAVSGWELSGSSCWTSSP